MKFEDLISKAASDPNSQVYFTQILIANKDTPQEFYIDPRTWTNPTGLKVVLPICFHGNFDWYICPDCGQIHIAYGYGKRETGCCMDIDCKRLLYIKNDSIFLQRDPVILLDEAGKV